MKTKTKTRILAWLVSACMLAAIIPAMPAEYASAATGATYVYDFTGVVSSDHALVSGVTEAGTETHTTDTTYDSYDETGKNWYVSDAAITLNATGESSSFVRIRSTDLYLNMRAKASGYVDVKVNVEKAGLYNISSAIQHTYGSAAGQVSISIVDSDIGTSTYDAGTMSVNLSDSAVYLEKAEYTVRYSVTGRASTTGSSNAAKLFVYSLTLTEVIPEIVASNAYPTAMQIGKTAKLNVTGVTLGEDSYEADVAVVSSVEDVISVGEDGTLTALAAGSSEITVTATYNEGETVSEKYGITVREPEVSGTYVYYMTGHMPDGSEALKDAIGKSFSTLSQSWELESFTGGTDVVRDSTLSNTNGVSILMRGNDKGTATLKIQVPTEGWYALSANVYESYDKNGNVATTSYSLNDGADKVLASCDNIAKGNNENAKADNVVYLKANTDYDFVFHAETGAGASRQTSYLKNIKLTSIPASEIFGETYAYVKDGTVYFIGGLNTIDGYSEVGFEVWVNGTQENDIKTSEVYKSFTVGTEITKTSTDFGVGEGGYIFITEKPDLNTNDVVTIRPYIKDANKKYYHDEDFILKLTI